MTIALTEEEIGYLIRNGELGADDLAGSAADIPDTTVKDGIAALVAAIGAIQMPQMPAMPKHPAPVVTVNVPKRGLIHLRMKVLKRDRDGFIDEVDLKEVAP